MKNVLCLLIPRIMFPSLRNHSYLHSPSTDRPDFSIEKQQNYNRKWLPRRLSTLLGRQKRCHMEVKISTRLMNILKLRVHFAGWPKVNTVTLIHHYVHKILQLVWGLHKLTLKLPPRTLNRLMNARPNIRIVNRFNSSARWKTKQTWPLRRADSCDNF